MTRPARRLALLRITLSCLLLTLAPVFAAAAHASIGEDLPLLTVFAPTEVPAGGGEFEIRAEVYNITTAAVSGVTVRLELAPDLTLVAGDASATIGDLASGETGQYVWRVSAPSICLGRPLAFDVYADWAERPPATAELHSPGAVLVHGTCGDIVGYVFEFLGGPLGNAEVDVCPVAGGPCAVATTDSSGAYSVSGLPPGPYDITARPPHGAPPPALVPVTVRVTIVSGGQHTLDFPLGGPDPLPLDTGVDPVMDYARGVPTVYWLRALTLSTRACPGGVASYSVTQGIVPLRDVIRSGPMTEGPAGSYTAPIAAFEPHHGYADVHIFVDCPGTDDDVSASFTIYIDPSGTVQTPSGDPIAGATVTLLRADDPAGPFEAVPDGSAIMSLANRSNPITTAADGHFGWDVAAGFYKVRAEKPGCVDAQTPATPFTETGVLTVPPPQLGLVLTLACEEEEGDLLSALGPATLFVGVANSDDNGRRIDVRVEVYRNGTLVGQGGADNLRAAGNRLANAASLTIALSLVGDADARTFRSGDTLSSRVLVRRRGGSGDFGVRFWYDAGAPGTGKGSSRFAATIGGATAPRYYRSGDALATAPGSSGLAKALTARTALQSLGTWSLTWP